MPQSEQVNIVLEIKLKILRLLEERSRLLAQVKELERQNQLLETELQQQKNTIQTLQTQNKMVKIAEMLPQDAPGRAELRKLVSDHIRQLEECIRLLSELA